MDQVAELKAALAAQAIVITKVEAEIADLKVAALPVDLSSVIAQAKANTTKLEALLPPVEAEAAPAEEPEAPEAEEV